MYDLSLVLESFSSVFRSCSTDVKFATFSSVLHLMQRYNFFLNYANILPIIFQKIAKKIVARRMTILQGESRNISFYQ